MADKTYSVNCGFFDSVDGDRLYSAEDFNRPTLELFGNGILATNNQNGFHVSKALGNNLNVTGGVAIFGGKWFYLDVAQTIKVDANEEANDRIDSIIAQVDTRSSGRSGAIIYRTGTASADPQPPALSTAQGVYEYRIANLLMPAGTSTPSDANIADLRGEPECPFLVNYEDSDSGWRSTALTNGTQGDYPFRYRKINHVVSFTGEITDIPAVQTTIMTLPSAYRPNRNHSYLAPVVTGSGVVSVLIKVATNGVITVEAGTYVSTDTLILDTSYFA